MKKIIAILFVMTLLASANSFAEETGVSFEDKLALAKKDKSKQCLASIDEVKNKKEIIRLFYAVETKKSGKVSIMISKEDELFGKMLSELIAECYPEVGVVIKLYQPGERVFFLSAKPQQAVVAESPKAEKAKLFDVNTSSFVGFAIGLFVGGNVVLFLISYLRDRKKEEPPLAEEIVPSETTTVPANTSDKEDRQVGPKEDYKTIPCAEDTIAEEPASKKKETTAEQRKELNEKIEVLRESEQVKEPLDNKGSQGLINKSIDDIIAREPEGPIGNRIKAVINKLLAQENTVGIRLANNNEVEPLSLLSDDATYRCFVIRCKKIDPETEEVSEREKYFHPLKIHASDRPSFYQTPGPLATAMSDILKDKDLRDHEIAAGRLVIKKVANKLPKSKDGLWEKIRTAFKGIGKSLAKAAMLLLITATLTWILFHINLSSSAEKTGLAIAGTLNLYLLDKWLKEAIKARFKIWADDKSIVANRRRHAFRVAFNAVYILTFASKIIR